MKFVFYGCVPDIVLQYICDLMDRGQGSVKKKLAQIGAVAFSDRSEELWGTEHFGLPVVAPHELNSIEYEKIIVCALSVDSACHDLVHKYKIPQNCIVDCWARTILNARIGFVQTTAQMLTEREVKGN